MNRIHESPGYSATVRLNLVFSGGVVPLEQVAEVWIKKSVVLPPGNAQVVVEVDGRESKRNVYLPEGMTGGIGYPCADSDDCVRILRLVGVQLSVLNLTGRI